LTQRRSNRSPSGHGFSSIVSGWLQGGRRPVALVLLLAIGVLLGIGVGSYFGNGKREQGGLPQQIGSQMPSTLMTPSPPQAEPSSASPAEPSAAKPPAQPQGVVPVPQPPAAKRTAPDKLTVPPEHGPYVATAIPEARVVAPPPSKDGTPQWLAYAVPMPGGAAGKPMIAVVIDDLGLDRKRSARVTDLPSPLTLAFLPYALELPAQTASGRVKGHELLVHVPMEPVGASFDPGPASSLLKTGLSESEIKARLERDLSQFEGFVGVNNHMGSKFTSDRAGMRVALAELQSRGLLFLDSRTSAQSVGAEVAREIGIPFAERNVFLDNEINRPAVEAQLSKLEGYARQYGHAIAIGHPHDATIEALSAWLPTLEAKGFALVPVSAIVKRQAASMARNGQKSTAP
jgi:polysaccharide deacetylase 2 family uncharacterized protein YibQ